jgi:hypothetical protein
MSLRLRRGTALFAVLLLVGAMGAPVFASEGREVRGGWWATVGAWLDQALGAVGFQPIFEESGCGIDPDGKPRPCPGSEIVRNDSVCSIDSNGRPCLDL